MQRLRRYQRQSRAVPVWRKDWTEFGLTPALKSSLASWTKTSGVSWSGSRVTITDSAGTAQSMAVAFTPSAENYVADAVVQFASGSNTLTYSLLSGVAGTVRFSIVIDAAANTIVINGTDDVTPAGFVATTAHRIRLVVKPGSTDVIAFCYYSSIDHRRLETGGGTKAWSYSGGIGALSLATDTTGTGTVYVQEVEVKPILAVIIGDSIATGHDSGASATGYDPTPYLTAGRSGATHTVKWYIEDLTGHEQTIVSQGTGGENLNEVISRYADYVADVLDGMSTRRVIVMAGTNDLAGSTTGAQALARVDTLIGLCAADSAEAIFAEIIPRNTFSATARETHRTDFNTGLPGRESATVRIAYTVANVPEVESAGDASIINPAHSDDGVHPHWAMYKLMGKQAFLVAWEEF